MMIFLIFCLSLIDKYKFPLSEIQILFLLPYHEFAVGLRLQLRYKLYFFFLISFIVLSMLSKNI